MGTVVVILKGGLIVCSAIFFYDYHFGSGSEHERTRNLIWAFGSLITSMV